MGEVRQNTMKAKLGMKQFMRENFCDDDFEGLFTDEEKERLAKVKEKKSNGKNDIWQQ